MTAAQRVTITIMLSIPVPAVLAAVAHDADSEMRALSAHPYWIIREYIVRALCVCILYAADVQYFQRYTSISWSSSQVRLCWVLFCCNLYMHYGVLLSVLVDIDTQCVPYLWFYRNQTCRFTEHICNESLSWISIPYSYYLIQQCIDDIFNN